MTAPSLTRFLDVPLADVAAGAVEGGLDLGLDELHAVVAEQALRIEAAATTDGLLEAGEALHVLAAWAAGRGDPAGLRASAKWEQLGEHLTDRAARSDAVGAAALLRSHKGKPREILALLAGAPGGSLARAALGQALGAGQSHLSHILRALHDAGLVHRHQAGKAVTITISDRGRQLVAGPAPGAAAPPAGDLPPAVRALRDQLPPQRQRQLADRPTMAPVIELPRELVASA